ncbi:MAG: alpha/beta hydrolase [Rhodocyclaceae bacterium]|nr:alpha/beta hydrolase [Rhodocyclaceae bacterium]MBX3671145.1 alpha/beta hydrolase [Rhodocyclaceae bacterium]
MSLHPQSIAFLEMIHRPGARPFHELGVAEARRESRKLYFAFRQPRRETVMLRDLVIDRPGAPMDARLYRPDELAGTLPVLLFFHGGGWTVGDLDCYDSTCSELAHQAGCAVLSVDYRLAPEHPFPAAVDDACYALSWLADHAPSLSVDAARIAVGGDSAGGNLAAVAALHARDSGGPPVCLQLLIYPSTDQRGERPSHQRYAENHLLTQSTIRHFQQCYMPKITDYTDWRASPLLAGHLSGLPPAYILLASHDPIADDGAAYAERLQREGCEVDLVVYEGMIHGFFALDRVFDTAAVAMRGAARALAGAFAGASIVANRKE